MMRMKIIVRVPNWIGDVVMSFPVVESLKLNFPQAAIWIAAKDWVKDLFAMNSLAEGVISLPESNDLKSLWETAQKLRTSEFDLGLLLTNSFGSAFLFYLAKVRKRWGYGTDGRHMLLTKSVSVKDEDKPRHQVYYYLDLLAKLGLKTVLPEIRLPLADREKEAARRRLDSLGVDSRNPLVVFSPGASYGPAKRWPASSFARLGMLFQERKTAEIAIIGSPEEEEIAASIASSMEKKPLLLAGKTSLSELLGLISQATLFITNDSGPLHLANALGVPVAAIFGPTNPAVTGPFQKPSFFVRKDVPCWPCSYRKCPYDHRCMTTIDPEDVYRASEDLWP